MRDLAQFIWYVRGRNFLGFIRGNQKLQYENISIILKSVLAGKFFEGAEKEGNE